MARRIFKSTPSPQNTQLARTADAAIHNKEYTAAPRECQRFVRQIVQKVYRSRFNAYHKGTAELSRRAWSTSPFAVDPKRGSVIGDILYKKGTPSNPAGHVGIRVAGNRVAENSTTRLGRIRGAKGYRTLAQFGQIDLIVRLPRDE